MAGATDLDVLRASASEQRVLITFDRDFGEIVFRSRIRPAPTTIYVRSGLAADCHAAQVISALQHVQPGSFVVLDGNRLRTRSIEA
jgi:predicted nuclease of predicted toxin-antitoxin system